MRAVLRKLCAAAALLACVAAATFWGVRAVSAAYREEGGGRGGAAAAWNGGNAPEEDGRWRYTHEDLKLVEAMEADGWEERSVDAFAKALADWTDEDAFHKREEAMERLRRTYEAEGEHRDFIARTLEASMGEAGTRHYGGLCTRHRDSFYDLAVKERQADVFGDAYTVFLAQVDYQARYTVIDGNKLTVGERDRILKAYREAVGEYLDGFTERQLMDEKAMEKRLQKQLERLDRQMSTDLIELEGSELVWYSAYGPESG